MSDPCDDCLSDAFECSTAPRGSYCRCDCHGERNSCDQCQEEADHKEPHGVYVLHGVVHDRTMLLCQSHKDRWDRRASDGDE